MKLNLYNEYIRKKTESIRGYNESCLKLVQFLQVIAI